MDHVIVLKQTCDIKNVALKVAKKLWVLRCTGKSNILNQSIKFIVIREAWLPTCPSQRLMFKM